MHSPLAATGTVEFLESLSHLVPDSYIDGIFLPRKTTGRPIAFRPSQLWRVHLLALLTPVHSFNLLVKSLPEQKSWRRFAHLSHRHRTPDARMLNEFRVRFGVMGFRAVNEHLLKGILSNRKSVLKTVALIDATDLQASATDQKKKEKMRFWSARKATLGARSLKAGCTRFFVGYKKHTLRLWLSEYPDAVLMVPVVSWAAPAHVPEGFLLVPSIYRCRQKFDWVPEIVVGDLGYIEQTRKRHLREKFGVAVVTKMKSDMTIKAPFETWNKVVCEHGQELAWLGFDHRHYEHWFGVEQTESLCGTCWKRSSCPREFSFPPSHHETLLGLLPLNSKAAQRLLTQCRSWVEATQSYDKNQLGLSRFFLNSLRLTWVCSLLADSVCLLKALLLLKSRPTPNLLRELWPSQTAFKFESEMRNPSEKGI